jgi:hypothetical protein
MGRPVGTNNFGFPGSSLILFNLTCKELLILRISLFSQLSILPDEPSLTAPCVRKTSQPRAHSCVISQLLESAFLKTRA